MGSNSTVWPNLTEEYCIEHGVLVATSLYNRFSLTIALVISLSSATYTTYFLFRYYSSSPFFHRNLKIFISSLLTFVLFNGQDFDGWYVNGRTLPLSAFSRANTVLFSMLGSNIVCLMLTITLHLLTPKRRIRMSLSSKFQRRENLIASKLFFYIATLQFTAYCCQQSASLYVRIYHPKDPMAPAYKENVDFFNLYTLAMPVLSTIYFAKVKRQRMKDIKNHLDIKTIGSDGWANYSTMIQKQWK
ncbi:hypothetical protein V3C99_007127 [Haemonchus contortus]